MIYYKKSPFGDFLYILDQIILKQNDSILE